MYCRNCGAENPESARFCSSCGTAVDPADASGDPTQVTPRAWGDYAPALARVTHGWMLAAALGAVGLIFALVGFLMVTTGGEQDTSILNGAVLGAFGALLTVIAVVAVAVSRLRPVASEQRPVAWAVGAGLAALGLIFSLVGLVKAYSDDFGTFEATQGWFPFGLALIFLAIAWFLATRPLPRSAAHLAAAAAGGLAFVFALVGLAIGLGEDFDLFTSSGWLGFGYAWALVAVAAALGRETADLAE